MVDEPSTRDPRAGAPTDERARALLEAELGRTQPGSLHQPAPPPPEAGGIPTQTTPPVVPAITRRSPSVQELLKGHRDSTLLTAGAVVAELLDSHRGYLDEGLSPGDIAHVGPPRTVAEHVERAASRWDPATTSELHSRHVVLGLALEPDVGWPLVQSGVVHSLITIWQPVRRRQGPDAVIWDLLSDAGRAAADEQPLLAAALGAPAEWGVTLPDDVTAVAWSSDGEQLAVLARDVVYTCAPEAEPARIGTAGPGASGLGWGRAGVIALSVNDLNATLTRIPDGQVLGTMTGVSDARIAGDGSGAWVVQASSGLLRWSHADPSPVPLREPDQPQAGSEAPATVEPTTEPGHPLALDHSGSAGLIERQGTLTLLTGIPRSGQPSWGKPALSDPDDGSSVLPEQASTLALAIPIGTRRRGAAALLAMGRRRGVALAGPAGGVVVEQVPFPPLARIATGPTPVTALAADQTGSRLAVAIGPQVEVWTLSPRRAGWDGVPKYDSDRATGPDLLEADRDARALAALVALEDLHPPLAIGLFGAWGSGKSFVINRFKYFVDRFTGHDPSGGYLSTVRVIEFNAWNYAETNLWASMVDQVLQAVGGVRTPDPPPEVQTARSDAEKARTAAASADLAVEQAKTTLRAAQAKLAKQRVRAARAAALVLVLLAIAVIAVVIGGWGRVVAAVSAALALLGSAAGVLDHAKRAQEQAGDLAEAGRSGWGTVERVIGRPEEAAVRVRGEDLTRREDAQAEAHKEADRLQAEADRVVGLAATEPLGSLLNRLSTITAYRDQLSLVTRTQEYFRQIDEAIGQERAARRKDREARAARAAQEAARGAGRDAMGDGADGQAGADAAVPLERIVVVIDDLDRCPPEKVVTVLEAVHLLFSFEMFVVMIAVDTRWLEQSLRIRYRQLLGRAGTATPSDYLEKIIQVPLHLLPLDATLIRTMIANLTGMSLDPAELETPPLPQVPDEVGPAAEDQAAPAGPLDGVTAQHPRPKRPALPAEVLRITQREATAMSVVAPLVGSTPRTVKRFVNTFQLLKARAPDLSGFNAARDGLGDHEVVACLLALVTGHPVVAAHLLPALRRAGPGVTVAAALNAVVLPADASAEQVASLAAVRGWLGSRPTYANARADRFADWAAEVARFSFTPPGVADSPGAS